MSSHAALDAGRHYRADCIPGPRPPRTGVAVLLAAERGTTLLLYRCRSEFVLVELDWKLHEHEKQLADQAAQPFCDAPADEVAKAIADALLCSITFWRARVRAEEDS